MRFVEKMPGKKKIIAKKTQVCVLASPSRLPDADDVKLPMLLLASSSSCLFTSTSFELT